MKIKIQSDFEKAKAIKKIVQNRKNFVKKIKNKDFDIIICENYYEIIKKLSTALLLCKGIKFVGDYAHKELIGETSKLVEFDNSLLVFLEDLRKRRNGSLYYGEPFERTYLENHDSKINFIIKQVEDFLEKEIKKNE